jgi:hypothetical protein
MSNNSKPLANKALGELFTSHLKQQINLFEQGLGAPSNLETAIPHGTLSDVGIDPIPAWKDSIFPTLTNTKGAIANISAPPGWQSLLFSLPALFGIPFASGHFPQAVRNPIELSNFIREEAGWPTLLPLPLAICSRSLHELQGQCSSRLGRWCFSQRVGCIEACRCRPRIQRPPA